jgi:hypothetical protein
MAIVFKDNSKEVLDTLHSNVGRLMTAWGQESVGLIVDNMESGYGKPIRVTGDLMRDVQYAPDNSKPDSVDVGNTLPYSVFVHEGTRRIKTPRHYVRDALLSAKAKNSLKALAKQILPEKL